jgi:hypothetical protein
MNFKRGLTRLWIVFSVLWISSMSIVLYGELTKEKIGSIFIGTDARFANAIFISDQKFAEPIREIDSPLPLDADYLLLIKKDADKDVKAAARESFLKQCLGQPNGVWSNDISIVSAYLLASQSIAKQKCEAFIRIGSTASQSNDIYKKDRIYAALKIILPPLVLYASVALMFWIVRGFRKEI